MKTININTLTDLLYSKLRKQTLRKLTRLKGYVCNKLHVVGILPAVKMKKANFIYA